MKAFITGSSALWFWRRTTNLHSILSNPDDAPLSSCIESLKHLDDLGLEWLGIGTNPIRLMVPSTKYRIGKERYSYRVQSNPLPPGSFLKLDNQVSIASPELCLLEAAPHLTRSQITELFMELAGYYALIPESDRGFEERAMPLISTTSVTKLAKALSGQRGSEKTLIAISSAREGSRSPMETRQFIMLDYSRRYGGYCIRGAQMNAKINLTFEEQTITGRKYLECDLYWPSHDVVIEYDGDPDHASFERRAADATKRNVLINQGKKVFTVTAKQILDSRAFYAVAKEIAAALNYRMRGFPNDWESRHARLRSELFASMRSSSDRLVF